MLHVRVAALLLLSGAVGCGFNDDGLGEALALIPDIAVSPDTYVAERDTAVEDNSVVVDSVIDTTPETAGDTAPETAGDTAPETAGDTAPEAAADAAPPCPEAGAVIFEGHCYFVLPTLRNFTDARAACAGTSPTAHLATITSAAEQAQIKALAAMREGWFGLRKDNAAPVARASFKWITGEPATFDGWAPEDPNGGHNCARLRSDGLWGDMSCSTTIASICERE